MKILKRSIILISILIMISCVAAPPNDSPLPTDKEPKVDNLGNTTWKSSRFNCEILIDNEYKYEFKGNIRRKLSNRIDDISVFSNGKGSAFYIVDTKYLDWRLPINSDPLKPAENVNGLLKYEPHEYSIWTGISSSSVDILENMGIEVPECKVSIIQSKINQSDRSEIVFVVFYKEWNCERSKYDGIIDECNKVLFLK